jgi:hypothetical protein
MQNFLLTRVASLPCHIRRRRFGNLFAKTKRQIAPGGYGFCQQTIAQPKSDALRDMLEPNAQKFWQQVSG